MINVAICDNDFSACTGLYSYIFNHFDSCTGKIEDFSNGVELLDSIYNGDIYNIIILNCIMSPLDGISIANIIRDLPNHRDVPVIFISAQSLSAEYFAEIQSCYFLRKPVNMNFFHRIFCHAIKTINDRQNYVCLHQKTGNVHVSAGDIFYLESCRRCKCVVHFETTSLVHYGSMSILQSELCTSNRSFIRTHSSYAVNLNHMRALTASLLTLSNGVSLPIGKSYRCGVVNEFMTGHDF